jgi:predicted transcriptional regulator
VADLPAPPLRVLIHARLQERPWLTADEIGRTIGRHPANVRKTLRLMEDDGEVEHRERIRTDGSSRVAAEWRAT